MNIVMKYDESDGYTYSCENVIPFEYESVEQAELDFLTLCESDDDFEFLGLYFYRNEFFLDSKTYVGPEFYTLQDWFDKFKR